MAPSGRVSRKRTKTKEPRKPRSRIHYKKQLLKKPNKNITTQEASSSIVVDQDLPSNSSSNSEISSTNCGKINDECLDFEDGGVDVSSSSSSSSACSTPKAQRFRIPKILTCPPAPKKQRVIPSCSIQRKPIAFFAPPDLELFFFFALRDISV